MLKATLIPGIAAPAAPQTITRPLWALVAVMAAATIGSFLLSGLAVDPVSNLLSLAGVAVLFVIGAFYRFMRPNLPISDTSIAGGLLLLMLLFGALLTYAAAAADFPYRDAELYAIDRALGLDRQAYLSFFHSRPWLQKCMEIIYLSLLPQFALTPLVMLISGQMLRLQRMIFAVGVALLLTAAVSVFTPAVNAFAYVDVTLPVLAKSSGIYTYVPTLEALRDGTLHVLRLDNLEGLVSFPSFHTAAALLFIWTLSTVPYLRWPALFLNLGLIAATPLVGGHYFIDLAGGAAVAAISLAVSAYFCRSIETAATKV
jgi:membrane-associated phospholipid phosphatase